MKNMIGQIELIAAEQELAGEIVFDVLTTRLEYEQGIKNGELAACIMESLMNRKAIPESRWLYFTDADYNPGKSKASRADLFLRNAKKVDQMHRHPHFLPYLRYFVYGADLPIALKEAFLEKAQDHWVRPSELAEAARSLVRSFNLPRHPQNYRLNDAFYQLALDCGCEEGVARAVREAVMKVK
jgi:hypothetical protein